jgi:Ca2+-binding RTX toxin-like protein
VTNNTIHVTPYSDSIRGLGGKDDLYGLGGGDHLWGDKGNDFLESGPGSDTIYGGRGKDIMHGDAARDVFFASGDNKQDWIGGGKGYDLAYMQENDHARGIEKIIWR